MPEATKVRLIVSPSSFSETVAALRVVYPEPVATRLVVGKPDSSAPMERLQHAPLVAWSHLENTICVEKLLDSHSRSRELSIRLGWVACASLKSGGESVESFELWRSGERASPDEAARFFRSIGDLALRNPKETLALVWGSAKSSGRERLENVVRERRYVVRFSGASPSFANTRLVAAGTQPGHAVACLVDPANELIVQRLTLDGSEPVEAPRQKLASPHLRAIVTGSSLWIVADDSLLVLDVASMSWVARERLPKHCFAARLASAGHDRILLGPATSMGRVITLCTRVQTSVSTRALEFGEPMESSMPDAVCPRAGDVELWAWGKRGKIEARAAEEVVSLTDVPSFTSVFDSGKALYGIGLLSEGRTGLDLLRFSPDPKFRELWPTAILGADAAGRLIVLRDKPSTKRMRDYVSPAEARQLEIVDPVDLKTLARTGLGLEAAVNIPFRRGSLLNVQNDVVTVLDWNGASQPPRAPGMMLLEELS